jgi:hypothetical protein
VAEKLGYRLGQVAMAVAIALFVFLAPAILAIWPFTGGLGEAVKLAFNNAGAWLGAAIFWILLGLIIFKRDAIGKGLGRFFVWFRNACNSQLSNCLPQNRQNEQTPNVVAGAEKGETTQAPPPMPKENKKQSDGKFHFQCPHCSRWLLVPEGSGGKKCKCVKCSSSIRVPNTTSEA